MTAISKKEPSIDIKRIEGILRVTPRDDSDNPESYVRIILAWLAR